MTVINAQGLHFQALNEQIRLADSEITVNDCMGQRYIGSGAYSKEIRIYGTPGNALGAYLDGGKIEVFGNVQDAVGDTMNNGTIIVHGSAGDALGYAMRGGLLLIQGNAGYRTGIHMKQYREKCPAIVIGGRAGSFLGEYQAGGQIVVLGLEGGNGAPVGNFCGTGMHGGRIFLRCETLPPDLPPQVMAEAATGADLFEIRPAVEEFCKAFDENVEKILASHFFVLKPNTKNPYHRLYTMN